LSEYVPSAGRGTGTPVLFVSFTMSPVTNTEKSGSPPSPPELLPLLLPELLPLLLPELLPLLLPELLPLLLPELLPLLLPSCSRCCYPSYCPSRCRSRRRRPRPGLSRCPHRTRRE